MVDRYSSSVDMLDTHTGKQSTASLALARQYFATAAAGGKVFFAGGFANDAASAGEAHAPIATRFQNGLHSNSRDLGCVLQPQRLQVLEGAGCTECKSRLELQDLD